jgi:hypothetical protein
LTDQTKETLAPLLLGIDFIFVTNNLGVL